MPRKEAVLLDLVGACRIIFELRAALSLPALLWKTATIDIPSLLSRLGPLVPSSTG